MKIASDTVRHVAPSGVTVKHGLATTTRMITMLASQAKQASVETQVVFATQSTLLLDHFLPEDVLVADRVEGGTQVTRLDGAALKEWLQDYRSWLDLLEQLPSAAN